MQQTDSYAKPAVGLSADPLIQTLRNRFTSVADSRRQASFVFSMASISNHFTKPSPTCSEKSDVAVRSSNAPHIADLESHNMKSLLRAKPGDHQQLFEQVEGAMEDGKDRMQRNQIASRKSTVNTQTQYIEDLALNKSNENARVNLLQHHEFYGDTWQR